MENFRRIEQILTVLCLFHYSQGLIPLLIIRGASEGDGVDVNSFNFAINLALFFLIYLITFGLLALRWKKVLHALTKDIWLWALVGLAMLSFLWSDSPDQAIRGGIGLLGTTVFGLYFATRYTLKEQLILLAWMYGLAMGLGLLMAIAPPRYGIMGGVHAGTFRGVFTHKNVFAKIMVPGSIIFFLLANSLKAQRKLLWGCFGLSFGLLVWARSSAALSNFVIMHGALFLYQTFRWRPSRLIPAIFGICTIGGGIIFLASTNAADLLGLIGKDPTLTGRTDMWPHIWEMAQRKMWFGYGFASFWDGLNGPSAEIIRAARWPVPNSHNGLLDTWLSVGAVGVGLFVLGFWTTLVRSVVLIRYTKAPESLWCLLSLTYLVLANITETSLLLQNDIFWVLYASVVVTAAISMESLRPIGLASDGHLADSHLADGHLADSPAYASEAASSPPQSHNPHPNN